MTGAGQDTIYVDLPTGEDYGAGVVGDSLAAALSELAPVERLCGRPTQLPLPGPLLEKVRPDFRPLHEGLSALRTVAFPVFERDIAARTNAFAAMQHYDAIGATCAWAENVLRQAGLNRVTTIPHGIDGTRFNPDRAPRRRSDSFTVFSGGKFEFRKGQDIVAQAFKVFAERHRDVFLVAAWHNRWPRFANSMHASPYVPFELAANEPVDAAIARWLCQTGIDMSRVELLPSVPNADLASVYGRSDVGLFPNRCEGATNLMLMEYMACGRTAIVTDFAGHHDIISDANSYPARAWRPIVIQDQGEAVACWCEPDVEEIVALLELAYNGRDTLSARGIRAAADMIAFTWDRAARAFLDLLVPA